MKMSTIEEYLEALFRDSGLVELRHSPKPDCWESYWFDNSNAMLALLPNLIGKGNLYTSLNAPKLRKVTNGRQQKPLKNDDVAFITRIPFDFDPERMTDNRHCPSTAEELSLAYQKMQDLKQYLRALDWPAPLQGMSGNGYHLQYRCRLPANTETKEALRKIYNGLKSELADPAVQFDTSVKSSGQIFRLYGSTNRKIFEFPDRPYRIATVWIPPNWRQVTGAQIDRLVDYFSRNTSQVYISTDRRTAVAGKGNYTTLDVVTWFKAHGLYERHLQDNMHDVTCPWEDEHSSSAPGDTIIFEGDGSSWPGFHCNHAHCSDRKIGEVINCLGDAGQFCSSEWRVQR